MDRQRVRDEDEYKKKLAHSFPGNHARVDRNGEIGGRQPPSAGTTLNDGCDG